MFSFSDIFNKQAPAAPAPAAAGAAAPTAPIVSQPDGAFTKSTSPDPVPVATAPLDTYKDLFTIDPNRKQEDPNAPYITYDDKDLGEKIGAMQFMQGDANSELAANALKGDPQALMQLMNIAVQTAYHQSAKLSATVAERATRAGVADVRTTMPEAMRSQLSADALFALNPNLAHPAIAPHVEKAREQFEQKYPSAKPAEIAKMTNEYMQAMASLQNPNTTPTANSNIAAIAGSQNFENFFGGSRR